MAGLVFALKSAERAPVRIVTKRQPSEGNTAYAQGGIAAAVGSDDDPESHLRDTIECGGGICDVAAVEAIIEGGPAGIEWLVAQGVPIARDTSGEFALGREGGHSRRRILHVQDATGRAIMTTLLAAVREHPNIEILPHHCAVDLIVENEGYRDARVLGAYVLDEATRRIEPFAAAVTMLATGGTGKAYKYTSNPDIATGDGVAMAWRAGCRVANLEFVQFHPTCLYHPDAKDFLITEAARGEGGYLTTLTGEPIEIPHPLGNLAPRDVVARAIDQTLKRRGERSVQLHLEGLDADLVRSRFPNIYETCLRFAIDITKQPIPVVPAAHYQCGGVMTDLMARTDLRGLLAAGEVAYTGLHGANRLASNSLLEALVMGARGAAAAAEDLETLGAISHLPAWDIGKATLPRETVLIDAHWDLVRALMWDFVGIARNDHRLELAARYLEIFRRSVESYYWDFVLDRDLIELRNLALVAELIVHSARARLESRGLHFNEDHPDRDEANFGGPTVLTPSADAVELAGHGEANRNRAT